MDKKFIPSIRNNDHRLLSKIITNIIEDDKIDREFYHELHPFTQDSIRIGITGPPGAGKSTLIDQIIQAILKDNKSVGVIAVDPTSPFTGGALLGDRVRMNKFSWNDNVFIRSMGSRGDLGGLAKRAQEVGDVLAASGKDIIIFETVGVGQGEYDVIRAVDIAIVILVPESGDEVQLMKAGLIEIADFFVINKSDRSGANRLATTLKSILHNNQLSEKLEPPVINTIAIKGDGINELYTKVFLHLENMKKEGIIAKKQLDRHRDRVYTLVQNNLLKEFWTSRRLKDLEQRTRDLDSIKSSAYEIADNIMRSTNI
jgi:LAO/AO transport system kinase